MTFMNFQLELLVKNPDKGRFMFRNLRCDDWAVGSALALWDGYRIANLRKCKKWDFGSIRGELGTQQGIFDVLWISQFKKKSRKIQKFTLSWLLVFLTNFILWQLVDNLSQRLFGIYILSKKLKKYKNSRLSSMARLRSKSVDCSLMFQYFQLSAGQ